MVQNIELFSATDKYSIGKNNNLKEIFVNGDVDISGNIAMSGNINFNNLNMFGNIILNNNWINDVSGILFADGTTLTSNQISSVGGSGGSVDLNSYADVSFGNMDISGQSKFQVSGVASKPFQVGCQYRFDTIGEFAQPAYFKNAFVIEAGRPIFGAGLTVTSQIMEVKEAANVGIHTNSPQSPLDVSATSIFRDTITGEDINLNGNLHARRINFPSGNYVDDIEGIKTLYVIEASIFNGNSIFNSDVNILGNIAMTGNIDTNRNINFNNGTINFIFDDYDNDNSVSRQNVFLRAGTSASDPKFEHKIVQEINGVVDSDTYEIAPLSDIGGPGNNANERLRFGGYQKRFKEVQIVAQDGIKVWAEHSTQNTLGNIECNRIDCGEIYGTGTITANSFIGDGSLLTNLPSEIPSLIGNNGKYLTTDGTNLSWDNVSLNNFTYNSDTSFNNVDISGTLEVQGNATFSNNVNISGTLTCSNLLETNRYFLKVQLLNDVNTGVSDATNYVLGGLGAQFSSSFNYNNGDWNQSTSIWTCPVDGIYRINAQVDFRVGATSSSDKIRQTQIDFFINGSGVARNGTIVEAVASGDDDFIQLNPQLNTLLEFNAGNTFQMKLTWEKNDTPPMIIRRSVGGTFICFERVAQ